MHHGWNTPRLRCSSRCSFSWRCFSLSSPSVLSVATPPQPRHRGAKLGGCTGCPWRTAPSWGVAEAWPRIWPRAAGFRRLFTPKIDVADSGREPKASSRHPLCLLSTGSTFELEAYKPTNGRTGPGLRVDERSTHLSQVVWYQERDPTHPRGDRLGLRPATGNAGWFRVFRLPRLHPRPQTSPRARRAPSGGIKMIHTPTTPVGG